MFFFVFLILLFTDRTPGGGGGRDTRFTLRVSFCGLRIDRSVSGVPSSMWSSSFAVLFRLMSRAVISKAARRSNVELVV